MATKSKKKTQKNKSTNASDNIQKTQIADSEKASVAKDTKKKEASKKDKKVQKKKDKNKKPGFFTRVKDFFKGVATELKKVNWLTKEELGRKTGFVAGFVAIFTLIVWIVDSGLGALAALLIGMK